MDNEDIKKVEYLLDHPDEISFAYQPIFNVKDNTVYGYETLMRPAPFNPIEFIEAARSINRLGDIEEITMIYGTMHLLEAGLKGKAFFNTLPEASLSPEVMEKCRRIGLKPLRGRNIYEILEYTNHNEEAWNAKVNAIRESNSEAQFAVDDFGTGDNIMFEVLDKYKPAIVKIDRSYIANIAFDRENQRIVDLMCHEIKKRGIMTLAEGVETEEEYYYLLDQDIDLMQGFYLGKPKLYTEYIEEAKKNKEQ
ncbi:MAG: EAL domain-containing protein [Lachnospiraceae bacterium]|nr:EAL domain-containing protein [Lachnospiraceae bacterium]